MFGFQAIIKVSLRSSKEHYPDTFSAAAEKKKMVCIEAMTLTMDFLSSIQNMA